MMASITQPRLSCNADASSRNFTDVEFQKLPWTTCSERQACTLPAQLKDWNMIMT
jgi:hypothetical protein